MTILSPSIKHFCDLTQYELYAILQARNEVFIVEQNCAYPDIDSYDLESFHVMIPFQGRLGAYCRILPPGQTYAEWSIGRVLTVKRARGQKLAHLLTKTALEMITAKGGNMARISAQSYLQKFYAQHGFVSIGEEYLEDNIPHIEMLRTNSPSMK